MGGQGALLSLPLTLDHAAVALVAVLALAVAGILAFSRPDDPPRYRVPGGRLEGTLVFDSRGSIEAAEVKIAGDSTVTFRARHMVVIGDGFSVDSGASLTVKTLSYAPRARP